MRYRTETNGIRPQKRGWTGYNLIYFNSWFRTSVESSRSKQSAMSSTIYSATVSVDNVRCYIDSYYEICTERALAKSSSNLIADELLRARTDTSTHRRRYIWGYGKKRSDTYERTSITRLIYSHSTSSRLGYIPKAVNRVRAPSLSRLCLEWVAKAITARRPRYTGLSVGFKTLQTIRFFDG